VFQKTGGWPQYERWGKEDDDFYARVSSQVPVLRENTPGLTHQWHPDTVLWKDRFTAHYPGMLEEFKRRDIAVAQLAAICSDGTSFILVDEARFGNDPLPGRRVLPFTESNGCYGGPPADDEAAISELERLRAVGARFIAFAWMSDWWFDYYRGFRQHLDSNYRRILTTSELVVFDLAPEQAEAI
jgi:hypothetical protein